MKITIVKEFTFDAAHYLPGYNGPCQFLHGHGFKLQVGFQGEANLETGMVMDFKEIKKKVDPLINELDHNCLNDCKLIAFPRELPTAENIIKWFVMRLAGSDSDSLALVRLWETPTSYAEWRKE